MILSTAMLSFALAAQAAHKEPPHHRESFVILLRHHLRSLDPGVAYDQNSYSIVANLYEPIIAFDGAQDRFKPWLATAVPTKANGLLSADGRTYRFPLRSGVRFHEGETLTAEDARYSLLREMLIETPGHSSSLLLRPLLGVDSALDAEGRWGLEQASVERAVRVEGGELVFELKKPFPGFLAMLAAWPAVMPKSWALAQGDWDGRIPKPGEPRLAASESLRFHANGTGAYRLVRSTGDGREAWFERFDGYWGPAPDIGKVYVRSEPHDAIRAALLRDGEADYAYVDGSDLAALGAEKDIKIETGIPNYATGETMFLTLALDGKDNSRLGSGLLDGAGIPPDFFKEPQVRQAFALSFDFDAYNREALGGYGKHAGGPIAETLLPGKVAPPYPYDLAKAKKLFKGAYGGLLWKRGFRLVMAYPRGLPRRQATSRACIRGTSSGRRSPTACPFRSSASRPTTPTRTPSLSSSFIPRVCSRARKPSPTPSWTGSRRRPPQSPIPRPGWRSTSASRSWRASAPIRSTPTITRMSAPTASISGASRATIPWAGWASRTFCTGRPFPGIRIPFGAV